MPDSTPTASLDQRFSGPDATAAPWDEARQLLELAELYFISTVRTDGRPHVTPLMAVWCDDALYFCTGRDEQKAKNIQANAACALTTGTTSMHEGLDVVVEGRAVRTTDDERLRALAAAWEAKYGADWHYDVVDGVFRADHGDALVFEVAPTKVLGFRNGDNPGQTTWRFAPR